MKSTTPRLPRIDASEVAKKLGAERADIEMSGAGSPPALLSLRKELASRLVSTGGRPRLAGTERRQKIPLTEEDWRALEELAEGLSDEDVRPTPGQVASQLLHRALERTGAELKRQPASGKDAGIGDLEEIDG